MSMLNDEDLALIQERFDEHDQDKDGYISVAECERIMADFMSEDQISEFFARSDSNKDGKISFDEFKATVN
ncbi:EF-hand domain-containing protein [Pseudomonas sp. Pseusp122]|uniref:EF-hand domain-containing protein n=1 Tax=unclassified Pseudomonas TaxID=196821 RepID=UPI0039A69DFE